MTHIVDLRQSREVIPILLSGRYEVENGLYILVVFQVSLRCWPIKWRFEAKRIQAQRRPLSVTDRCFGFIAKLREKKSMSAAMGSLDASM